MNTSELIKAVTCAEEGDQSAITALYNYTYPDAFRLLCSICGSRDTAEDILQESYIKAFRNLGKLRKKESFGSWFNVIAVNTWMSYAKRSKENVYAVSLEELDENSSVSDTEMGDMFEKKEADSELLKAVNELPENQRICVILFYYNNMSLEEISKALNIPKGSVKSRLHYARLKLKNRLADKIDMFECFAAAAPIGSSNKAMLADILQALAETGGSQIAVSGIRLGLAAKLAAGLISAGLVTGGVYRAVSESTGRRDLPPTPTSSHVTITTTAAETTTTTAATTSPTVTTVTTTLPAATTAAPPKVNTFGTREVSGGVEITACSCDDPDVVIPSKIDGKPVVSIAEGVFSGNNSIRSLNVPGSISHIGDNAFRSCKRLATLKLNSGLSEIGDMAFLGCESLTSVTVPGSVRRIGIYSFAYCYKLKRVTVGDGVREIGYCSFFDCKALQYISLPESVEDIGVSTFSGCPDSLTIAAKDGTYSYDYGISEGINVEIP